MRSSLAESRSVEHWEDRPLRRMPPLSGCRSCGARDSEKSHEAPGERGREAARILTVFGAGGKIGQITDRRAVMTDLVVHDLPAAPTRLRGHTLLCLQGFQGKGYSEHFVSNMAAIHRALSERPETYVEVTDSPDVICAACPHHQSAGCELNGEGSEEELKAQDHAVLRRLGLEVGARVRWTEVLDRIRSSVQGGDLPGLCGSCRWLALGHCRDGIDALSGQASAHDETAHRAEDGQRRAV